MTVTKLKRPSDLTSLERFNIYYKDGEDEPKTAGEKAKLFLWNPKTKQFCGRTGSSWSKICTFYLIFYLALAALVAICMWTFLQLLDARQPMWQLDQSIIGTNPGLGFRPMPDEEASSIIRYKGNDPGSYKFWVHKLTSFLQIYKRDGKTARAGKNIHNCDFKLPPPAGKVCDVDINAWGPCSAENGFAYNKSTPCIFLKLNKIFGWIPKFYNSSDNLPKAMPSDLVEHIRNMTAYDKNYVHKQPRPQFSQYAPTHRRLHHRRLLPASMPTHTLHLENTDKLKMVWVSCQGENPADRESIGPIQYLPYRGFPGYYFPYTNQVGYLSPLVAVHFQRPKTGILINVECRAWAHNIKYDRAEGMGSVHIEVMVE